MAAKKVLDMRVKCMERGPLMEAWFSITVEGAPESQFLIGSMAMMLINADPKSYETFQKLMVDTVQIIMINFGNAPMDEPLAFTVVPPGTKLQ